MLGTERRGTAAQSRDGCLDNLTLKTTGRLEPGSLGQFGQPSGVDIVWLTLRECAYTLAGLDEI
jgi:hypothetical protein